MSHRGFAPYTVASVATDIFESACLLDSALDRPHPRFAAQLVVIEDSNRPADLRLYWHVSIRPLTAERLANGWAEFIPREHSYMQAAVELARELVARPMQTAPLKLAEVAG